MSDKRQHSKPLNGSIRIINEKSNADVISELAKHAPVKKTYSTGSASKLKSSQRKVSWSKEKIDSNQTIDRSQSNPRSESQLSYASGLKEWLSEKAVKAIQETTDLEQKKAQEIYEPVLEREDSFVKDVADFLEYKRVSDLRRKEILHKQWTRSVYRPIERTIFKEMNGPSFTELDRRKRTLHKEYIENMNKKGHNFLDIISPAEYYPMSLFPTRPSLIVARTKRLQDPLLNQERARTAEDRVVYRCINGTVYTDAEIEQIRRAGPQFAPTLREKLTPNDWLTLSYAQIDSPERLLTRQRLASAPDHSATRDAMRDWARKCDPTQVDRELQIPRRRRFRMQHMESTVPMWSAPPLAISPHEAPEPIKLQAY